MPDAAQDPGEQSGTATADSAPESSGLDLTPGWVRPERNGPTDGQVAGTDLAVGLEQIERARSRIEDVAVTTPMLAARELSAQTGLTVQYKCENLQRSGSFKVRGASARIAALTEAERDRGVVAASAGNHAQGVALAAARRGIRARIVMPRGVALPKLQATRSYGAEVVLHGASVDEALAEAERHAQHSGAVLLHPFDHPEIVAGQGTVGLEILEQMPEVETVVVGMGGGGLIAGVALAVKQRAAQLGRRVRVVGVQAAEAAAYVGSLEAGQVTALKSVSTIADGIAVARPGQVPFEIIRDTVDAVVTVSEDEIAGAIVHLMERAKLVVEPAGAVGAAALLSGRIQALGLDPGPTAVVLSGGNIDPMLMLKSIQSGLAVSGRYLGVRIALRDRPGELATISRIIAEAEANVVRVDHTRAGPEPAVSGVYIVIDMETRGHEHSARVLAALRAHDYRCDRLY